MRRSAVSRFVLAWLCALLSSRLLADGTQLGTIAGRVSDESGAPLPGAAVAVTNTDQGVTRNTITDPSGRFHVPLLQPGPYRVTVTLSGFETFTAGENVVSVEKTTDLRVTLRLGKVQESLVVTGEVPIVDRTNASAGTRVDSALTQNLPIARNYQNLALTAPGVVLPGNANANPYVHGALSTDNLFLFDGIDTTDPTTGGFGQNFTYEAIQEVSVTTSAASAEFGRATGGIINVITKSGSNRIAASFKVIMTNDNWNAQNSGSNPVANADGSHTPFTRDILNETFPVYAATLGGPLWKDHAWIFGAYETDRVTSAERQTVDPTDPQNFVSSPQDKFYDVKATWNVTPSQLVTGKVNAGPTTDIVVDRHNGGINAIPRFAADLGAMNIQDQKSRARALQYSGVFGSSFSLEGALADANININFRPFQDDLPVHQVQSTGLFYNGPSIVGFLERARTQGNLAGNWYTSLGNTRHSVKVGFDYQALRSTVDQRFGGGQLFIDQSFDVATRQYVPLFRRDYDPPAESSSTGKHLAFFALDRVEIGSRLSMNVGLRFEHQTGNSDLGTTVVDTNTVSPRISGTYDLLGTGKTLVVASYGRYDQGILQTFDDLFASTPQKTNYNLYTWNPASQQFVFTSRFQVGGNATQVDPNLKPTSLDEVTAGLEHQLGDVIGLGLRGTYRNWSNLIDDVIDYNPDGKTTFRHFLNYDGASRRYFGLELTAVKRFAKDWGAQVSYAYSRSTGNDFSAVNTDLGNYLNETCQVPGDSTVGTNGLIPCRTVQEGPNKEGMAPFDRPHVAHAYLAYHVPVKAPNIVLGTSYVFQSGDTYQKQRTVNVLSPSGAAATTATYYYEPAGGTRLPSIYQLDVSAEASYPLWQTLEAGLKFEVFNLTNVQRQIQANLLTWCDAPTSACDAVRSSYGAGTSRNSYQAPRNLRLTALVRF
jgi:outer membrane receptor protein involved in Fe transport